MSHIDSLFWWTGSLVWVLIGGGAILALLAGAALVIGTLTWGYGMRMVGDITGLNNVRRWVAAGKPNAAALDKHAEEKPT